MTPDPPSHTALVRRARRINRELAELYPDVHTELNFGTPLELLVATILSAQTTDKRVNLVTPVLFARYRTAADYAAADRGEMEKIIQSDRVLPGQDQQPDRPGPGAVRAVRRRGAGAAWPSWSPCPGSGARPRTSCWATRSACPASRWTRTSPGCPAGSAGPRQTDPVKIESEVGALFPRREWTMLSHRLIWHGRRVCHARKPACGACELARLCPSYGIGPTDEKTARALVKEGPFS